MSNKYSGMPVALSFEKVYRFLNQRLHFRDSKPNRCVQIILRCFFYGNCNCKGGIVLNSFNFLSETFIIWLVIYYITVVQMRSHKWFIYCNNRMSGRDLLSFLMINIRFIALDIYSLIWRLKFRVSSKCIPKCFAN